MPTSNKTLRKTASRIRASGKSRGGREKKRQKPKLKLQIDLSDGSRLGPGKIMLLEAIDRAGSLSRGAAEMGISYRRAWLFMNQINTSFDQPAIATPPGGHGGAPSQLTDFGRQLVAVFRKMEVDAERASAKGMSWVLRHTN